MDRDESVAHFLFCITLAGHITGWCVFVSMRRYQGCVCVCVCVLYCGLMRVYEEYGVKKGERETWCQH